ncbi:unnamed protein product [Heligmosomoides polygyrus]|uniref:MADF domain-containing protein n=1 Tax=Heligmosomoides polygyrus TaxID=6339 RepID=A0A183GTK7_HELPZ|nr:unnamed protein product [Heligmosomoides polygyrus]
MEEGEGTPRMRFVACGRDDKKPYMRMVQAGRKRSTGDRSPERNSDEDLDIMEDVHSVVAAVLAERGAEQRGEIHQRFAEMFFNLHFQFFPEPPQERGFEKRNLWDITSAAYKDKQRSDVDWHHVKEELNAAFNSCYEVDDVKKQWKNLRDSFQKRMKAAKKPKTGSGAGDPPTKWIFWEAMQFLLDFNDEEPTMSNVGAFASTTLRKLAASDEEAAELVVLELSENLSKLVREALARKRSVR